MYCTRCGVQIDDQALYCSQCGAATINEARSHRMHPKGPLSRPRENIKVAGVCAGVARYLEIDVTLVRVIWALVSIYPPGAGVLAYFICMFVMPKDPLPPVAAPSPAATAQV